MADWIHDSGITAFSASTSLFRSFMASLGTHQQLTPVRVVRIGGELAVVVGAGARGGRDAVPAGVVHHHAPSGALDGLVPAL